ncbi:MAG: Asp-tRNA(Asn)/Glu-tRNA(Gln) amidotransferase subunit GatC [Vicinamibacterales bacterium]
MSDITREKVQALAALANVALSDTEVDLFARQLRDFLEYAETVQRIDTSGVPPTASLGTGDEADRPDLVVPSLARESALANAPDGAPDSGFFRVPRVIG